MCMKKKSPSHVVWGKFFVNKSYAALDFSDGYTCAFGLYTLDGHKHFSLEQREELSWPGHKEDYLKRRLVLRDDLMQRHGLYHS